MHSNKNDELHYVFIKWYSTRDQEGPYVNLSWFKTKVNQLNQYLHKIIYNMYNTTLRNINYLKES